MSDNNPQPGSSKGPGSRSTASGQDGLWPKESQSSFSRNQAKVMQSGLNQLMSDAADEDEICRLLGEVTKELNKELETFAKMMEFAQKTQLFQSGGPSPSSAKVAMKEEDTGASEDSEEDGQGSSSLLSSSHVAFENQPDF